MKAEHLISSKSRHRDIFQNVLQPFSDSQISWQMLQNRNVKVGNYYCVQFWSSAHCKIKLTRRERKDDSDISKQKLRLTCPRKFPTFFVKLQNCQSQVILPSKKVVSILSWKDQRVTKRDSISQWTASKKSNLKLARLQMVQSSSLECWAEIDISVLKLLGFETLPILWGFRSRRIWSWKKKARFWRVWFRKKVSVSENLVSKKKSWFRFFENLVSEKKKSK